MIADARNASSPASTADHIREVERSRIKALVTREMYVLRRLHAPEYQLITPLGRTYSRERYLREIEAGQLRYLRWEHGAMDVRASERMAMVRYRATLELDAGDGHGTPFECWHTDSYELTGGTWQVVWSQATAIR
jgi:hypothetical protein